MIISDLPGDLLEEILYRVPATSVKRLRSVCKRWNRLVNDNRFIRKLLDKAAKQFLILDLKEFRVFSMSVNLHGIPSIEVIDQLSLNDSQLISAQSNIGQVSYCDGLLLCTIKDDDTRRIVVWNPCTGQTKWIHGGDRGKQSECTSIYTLGSYQDNKSGNNSYKVLRMICHVVLELEICDINSNSWRKIDGPGSNILLKFCSVSLKGKTYWFGKDRNKEHVCLVSFDYERERFELLFLDPCQFPNVLLKDVALSVVREEKLSMLLQRPQALRKEIWLTSKIDETKAVSWIKVFTVDYPESIIGFLMGYFLVDEEKKAVLMCCLKWNEPWCKGMSKSIYVVGENNRVLAEFGASHSSRRLYNYVPSLIQFH
ncbi:unnamed protein product [Microthlaspi erraticum]|uniref:F-box domain-containing protein n=1 Tax=Microthlaspi erraticum TaxID=1685480 RepID=A0A6D2J214_9BRAS|nr:unnamed protein product [Microthlaspi erraticum]